MRVLLAIRYSNGILVSLPEFVYLLAELSGISVFFLECFATIREETKRKNIYNKGGEEESKRK